jgi:hypothetical protein
VRRLVLLALLAFPAGAWASHEGYTPAWWSSPASGPSGGDVLNIPLGAIRGVRDIECGKHTTDRADVNCDIGAGSAVHRGDVNLNWDIGRCVRIYDGHKNRVASFCPRRIVFYRPVVYR